MLFSLQHIAKGYGNKEDGTFQQVLNDLSLEVQSGDTLSILGPSGSGKSTLLNILGTLDYPDEGSYHFRDKDITGLSPEELNHFRNKEIGFVFQFHHLLPQCNVLENVLIPTLLDKHGAKKNADYAAELLNKVGLWEHRNKRPAQLSGGECQRVAVVRSMINRPSLILADEPTGALDGKNVDAIADLLLSLNKEASVTLILVTHSTELAKQMKTVYELSEGQLRRQ